MSSATKKAPGARGILQPFNRQAGHAPQQKPVVAQLKRGVSAQTIRQPLAPPIYRPQVTPKAVQPKMANGAVNRKPPVAPPVYRPQPVPKVLQTKSSSAHNPQAGQSPRRPVAPTVYRPEAKKLVQPKISAAAQSRTFPNAPPVYRPQPTPRVLQTKASQTRSDVAVGRGKPVTQRGGHVQAKAAASRPATAGVIQPLIIRIRDVSEMVGYAKPTIMNASKHIKKDVPSTQSHWQDDIGISKAIGSDGRQLDDGEPLVVVSHGSEPSLGGMLSTGIPRLGGNYPDALAAKVAGLFPKNYNGSIYLDGCYTGKRLQYKDGTSYIELFAAALGAMRKDINFTVKGNLGAAATSSEGIEYITLTQEEANLGKARGWMVYEVQKEGVTEYKVASPFGLAYCRKDGGYQDMGLTEQARKKALDDAQRAELDRLIDLRMSLSPTMTTQQQDQIWNEML